MNPHQCNRCPHDLTVVRKFEKGKDVVDVPIRDLSDDDLLCEYAGEVDGGSRRISTDAPSNEDNLREEILRRMRR
jgi:hypothetical protein